MQTRYVVKYRHCDGKLVLKVTDNKEVCTPCLLLYVFDLMISMIVFFFLWYDTDLGGFRNYSWTFVFALVLSWWMLKHVYVC